MDIQEMRAKLLQATSSRDKAQGQYQQVLQTLKKEFNISSLEEVEELLKIKNQEMDRLKKRISVRKDRFEKAWEIRKSNLQEIENAS